MKSFMRLKITDSPYIRRPIPILNDAWQTMHWAPVLIIYTLGVSLIAFIIFLFFYLIFTAKKKRSKQ